MFMNPKIIRAMCVAGYNLSDQKVWIAEIDTRIFESMTYLEHDGDFYIIQHIISSDSAFLRDQNRCDCIIMVSKSDGYSKRFDPKELTEVMKTNRPMMPACISLPPKEFKLNNRIFEVEKNETE